MLRCYEKKEGNGSVQSPTEKYAYNKYTIQVNVYN